MKRVFSNIAMIILIVVTVLSLTCCQFDDTGKQGAADNGNQDEFNDPTPNPDGDNNEESDKNTDDDNPADNKDENLPHNHVFGDWNVISVASCTESGERRRYCSCGEEEIEITSPTEHRRGTQIIENEQNPTCETDGSYDTVVYCRVCNYEMERETVTVTKLGHNFSYLSTTVIQEPTCTDMGVERVDEQCSICNEIRSSTVSTATTGHIPSDPVQEIVTEPTCIKKGRANEVVYCSVCDYIISSRSVSISSLGHTKSEVKIEVISLATCTSEGEEKHYTDCIRCGKDMDCEVVKTPTLDHVKGEPVKENIKMGVGTHDLVTYCLTCGNEVSRIFVDVDEVVHTPGEPRVTIVYSEPTCTSTGSYKEVVECTECGRVLSSERKTSEKIPHTPGEMSEDRIITAPTCIAEGLGYNALLCAKCGTELSRVEKTLPTVDHTYGEIYFGTLVPTTCTEPGQDMHFRECSVCKDIEILETFESAPYGHDTINEVGPRVEPTCTQQGSESVIVRCKRCDEVVDTIISLISAIGHKGGTPVIENELQATCTTDGSYDTVTYCLVCEGEASRVTTVIKAQGHAPLAAVVENSVDPTCSAYGTYDEVVYCDICDEVVSRVKKTVDKLPHIYDLITCTVCGAEAECNDGLNLVLNEEGTGYILVGLNECKDEIIYLTTRDSLPVVEIGASAFSGSSIKKIIIGESVSQIDDRAFCSCRAEDIVLLDGNKDFAVIDESLYTADGKSLVRFMSSRDDAEYILDGSLNIYSGAFSYNQDITSLTVTGSASVIPTSMFENCSNLKSVVINTDLEYIGSSAFVNCSALTNLEFNAEIGYINNASFGSCSSLKTLVLTDGVKQLVGGCFDGCSSLEIVIIGNSIKVIPQSAFDGCDSLKEVVMPAGLTKIDHFAFSSKVLDSIYYMGDADMWDDISIGVVSSVEKATKYYYRETKPLMPDNYWRYVDGKPVAWPPIPEGEGSKGLIYQINDDLLTYTVVSFRDCPDEHIVIPSTYNDMPVVAIETTEMGCSAKSITIPDSITTLSNVAFRGSVHLETVRLPSGITSIPAFMFADCTALIEIVIPEGVVEICDDAFVNCTSLVSVSLPSTLEKITGYPFYNCNNLMQIYNASEYITLEKGSEDYGMIAKNARNIYTPNDGSDKLGQEGDFKFYCDEYVCILYRYSGSESSVVLPERLNGRKYTVSENAFINALLTSLHISSGVETIMEKTLDGQSLLSNITVSDESDVYAAYNGMLYSKDMTAVIRCPIKYDVASVQFYDGVTTIAARAFYWCRGIQNLEIPDSVKQIGDYAFSVCTSLTNVSFGSGIEAIGVSAFEKCISLTSITIPESVTELGENVLSGCQSLERIIFNCRITRLHYNMFWDCSSLESIYIPDSITVIITNMRKLGDFDALDVYYQGSEADWLNIVTQRPSGLEVELDLTGVTIHYES